MVNKSKLTKRRLLNNNKKEHNFVKHMANMYFLIAIFVPKIYLPNFGKKPSSNIREKLYFIIFVIYYFVIYQVLFAICYGYQVNLEDRQRKKMKTKLQKNGTTKLQCFCLLSSESAHVELKVYWNNLYSLGYNVSSIIH